ncbi:MAG: M1 family metallopeptidase [Candidatus Palauibacterales bacterium]|nr:M1 family metallopeptidase [Candidatus Palauibacterales bacterium]MDP2585114.1 M1 family metallopeptidase [Candidatus Palauibacterales bacterium]
MSFPLRLSLLAVVLPAVAGVGPVVADAAPAVWPRANPVASARPVTAIPPGRSARAGTAAADTAFDPSPGFDVLAYDLSLDLRDGSDSIDALQRVRALVTTDTLRSLRLDLRGLRVDSASVEGRRVRVDRRGDTLLLPVPADLRFVTGDTVTASVAYHGRPADGLMMTRDVHGQWTVFADNWPDRARNWFASVDHPADKAAVTLRVTMPSDWTSVANGVRVLDLPLPDGRRRQVWVEKVPIPVYTMVVGAGRLAVEDGGVARVGPGRRAVPIHYVVFPEDAARGPELFGAAARIVETFSRLFGAYPYRKLDLVESATRYGGMENTTAIFFPEEGVSRGSVTESTVAHEITHQWFGDGVTEARWRDLWLSEGFASYGDALWQETSRGRDAYRRRMAEFEARYLASDAVGRPVLGPVPSDLTRLLDANAYQKGAWVLGMLRGLVGDSAFFGGLRRYFARYRGESALTPRFESAMEDVSGLDLGWFFDQWLRRPGAPRVVVDWSWDAGGGSLALAACQTQPGAPYRLRVPVRVAAVAGKDTTVILRMEDRAAEVRVSLGAAPDSVSADPHDTILGPVMARRVSAGAAEACRSSGGPPGNASPGGRSESGAASFRGRTERP